MARIVLGMSGGVDSSVCAYLLKKEGHQVIGVFMRNWDSALNNDIHGNSTLNNPICPQQEDYLDAKKVADRLGITLHQVDFIEDYWNLVFKDMIAQYKKGLTPNPDILCNKYIKFDAFIKYVDKKFEPDLIAMGHYAYAKNGHLFKAIDRSKDQTYFLAKLSKKQLKRAIFPLAKLTKKEVRTIAREQKLETAHKKDSTGICFIGERKFQNFLTNYIPSQPGDIIDINSGKKIGTHPGVMYYTIGQRKGLNLGGMVEPYFVVGNNLERRILFVTGKSHQEWLLADQCKLVDFHQINDDITLWNSNHLSAKFRYRQAEQKVKIFINNNKSKKSMVKVDFAEPISAITPGQECVFYYKNECIGSGTISEVFYQGKSKKL